jgi:hypothetical protein
MISNGLVLDAVRPGVRLIGVFGPGYVWEPDKRIWPN